MSILTLLGRAVDAHVDVVRGGVVVVGGVGSF
jgi:hypothetical protein